MGTFLIPAILALTVQTAPQGSADERSVFEAVLKSLLGDDLPAKLLIQSAPREFRYVDEFDWKKFGASPDVIAAKLKGISPASLTADSLPVGTQLIATEDLMDLFNPKNRNLEDAWALLRSKYKVQSMQAFSRPLITDDGLDAWVMFSHSCGSLCGAYGYAVLHRTSRTTPWAVTKRVKIVS